MLTTFGSADILHLFSFSTHSPCRNILHRRLNMHITQLSASRVRVRGSVSVFLVQFLQEIQTTLLLLNPSGVARLINGGERAYSYIRVHRP